MNLDSPTYVAESTYEVLFYAFLIQNITLYYLYITTQRKIFFPWENKYLVLTNATYTHSSKCITNEIVIAQINTLLRSRNFT